MAETISELRALSDDDLIKRHDHHAPNVQVTTGHYLQELHRRDQKRLAEAMLKYTCQIRTMTWVITVVTIINVALFAISVYSSFDLGW
ncbi:MAG: hypothetical protein ACREJ5_17930 [Geminicoccaceae bacterium]